MCTSGFCGSVGCQSFGTTTGYLGCQRTVAVTALPCEDIRLTGTRSNVGDDSSIAVALPFSFSLFGTPYTSVQLTAQGTLNFNGTTSSTVNSCLPSGTTPMISLFWEHLHPGGAVYYQTFGTAPNRRFVILWDETSGRLEPRVFKARTPPREGAPDARFKRPVPRVIS